MSLFVRVLRRLAWVAAAGVLAVPLGTPGGPLSLLAVSAQQPSLHITGSVSGLVPGRPAGLTLTVTSRSSSAVVVRALTARVTAASPGCPTSALLVGSWQGRLTVPADGSAQATLPIRLPAHERGCTGASWQLAYTST